MNDTEVPMGELAVTKEGRNLISSAVGSCLVITLYEPKLKIAGMIHAMLPYTHESGAKQSRPEGDARADAKYVNTAIDIALEKMHSLGADRKNIEAKLAGGANMFGFTNSDIGQENIKSAKGKLREAGIKLLAESTGGSQGRSVEFSCASGMVTVKIQF